MQLFGTGTYTTADGQVHQLGDAAFRYTNETMPPPTPTLPREGGGGVSTGGAVAAESAITTQPDAAEIMRMALVFVQTVATLSADASSDPLTGGVAATPTDPLIVPDDPMGMMAGASPS